MKYYGIFFHTPKGCTFDTWAGFYDTPSLVIDGIKDNWEDVVSDMAKLTVAAIPHAEGYFVVELDYDE